MIPFLPYFPWKRAAINLLAVGLFLTLGLIATQLVADTGDATPVATPAEPESFGHYLVDHQQEIAPFFAKNGDALVKELVPVLLQLFGRIVFISLLAGWAINILLGRAFAGFFAPIYAKIRHAIIYATGELVVSLIAFALLTGVVIVLPGVIQSQDFFFLFLMLAILVPFAVQVGWVSYAYRTNYVMSGLFYLAVFVVHTVTMIITAAPILGAGVPISIANYVDQNVTSKLQAEIRATKLKVTASHEAHEDAVSSVAASQAQLTQAETDQQDLQKQIDDRKKSEPWLFSRIAQVRANGDWVAARAQFTDLIAKFPNGPMTDAAKAQVAAIDSDTASREAKKKQADADAAQKQAAYKADLLARAAKGQVTLSEMRRALVGKTLLEIKQMFGLPTEVASDRWGYGQQMINDPVANRQTGLTIYFSDGVVQSVDHYYGTAPAK